ncbi:MAG: LysR family transcriptional regulator [Deltaproteobacteria bacterium]|nr:LysR family transcriptional regulator [Deltaproteobacteria bacterium]MBT8480102.1 LysR family transcriptional regulator [Deltaproteobacteria bacterium]NND30487.1 LysR family transcriptional regulator [Myxococcales bacterium]NNK06499.1 LysR family transcriptional regulator [Myxococcales bacterium]NNL22969.1 LysR family transcriptional regulator [Myxococcales bacterium]
MSSTHAIDGLQRIDLNLLVALDALARERSVTKAAERAGVTQSAMSHTLRRLRELFDDPLLVRGRGGMVLTPRAEALAVPLRSGLVSLARTLAEPAAFEPEDARRTFRIVSPDLFDALVLPTLLQRLGRDAPSVDLAVVPMPKRLSDSLETGDVDLAIYPVLLDPEPFDLGTQVDAELQSRTLFRDSFRCFVRSDHPSLGGRRKLTLKAFTSLNHVLVSPGGEGAGLVDRILRAEGLERRIALRVPHFATALEVIAQSDLLLTAPSSLGRCPSASALASRPAPLDIPEHAITMIWHPRFTEDPAHRWLRELMIDVTAEIPSLPPKRSRP